MEKYIIDNDIKLILNEYDTPKLEELLSIAKLNDQPKTKEILLRRLLKLNPDNSKYKIDLAKSLIKQYNRRPKGNRGNPTTDPQLCEAKTILLEELTKDPLNMEILKFLEILGQLQNYVEDRIKYLTMMINIDPNGEELHLKLASLITRFPAKKQEKPYFDDGMALFVENPDSPFNILFETLANKLRGRWNYNLIITILSQISAERSATKEDLILIKHMIEKIEKNPKQKPYSLLHTMKGLSQGLRK